MTIKTCTCGRICTTKNSKFIGKTDIGPMLMFNCQCGSTICLLDRETKKALAVKRALNGGKIA